MSKNDFTPQEFENRLERVRRAIAEQGLDWMVLFHPVSIHWLTGSDAKSYQAFQCLFVSAMSGPTIMLTRESERYEFEQDALVDALETWGGPEPQDPLHVFAAIADRMKLARARVGIEVPAYYLHPHHYLRVKDLLGNALVAEPSNLVHDLKMVKSPAELAYIRKAAAIADGSIEVFARALTVGRSELAVAGTVYGHLMELGGGQAASTLNLVSGERAVFSHGAPTERRLQHGDSGSIEYGVAYRRYTATIGRQFSMGKPGARLKEIYAVVREAGDACIATIRAGVPATAPHEAAKAIIEAAGFDRYRVHTSGYGLAPGFPPSWGEPVNMFGGNGYVLQAGMVVSVEPPVFHGVDGIGVRLIDNVLITETGGELLTKSPRDLIVV